VEQVALINIIIGPVLPGKIGILEIFCGCGTADGTE
jgi:hypothetical protein